MQIPQGHDDIYYEAKHTENEATLYEHCVRSIKSACRFGAHSLVLMGSGDWNDGMNNIGKDGGESVFMSFFLLVTMEKFMYIATKKNDAAMCGFMKNTIQSLRKAVEEHAWDGDRFRRAFYSDGTPLGDKTNRECAIDLISQVWGVFSERKRNPERCRRAMISVHALLRDEAAGIIKLLTPPFSDTDNTHYAGYIESYAEGVRENGGQYTHAAVWYLIAQCLTDSDESVMKTFRLLNPAEKDYLRYMSEPYAVAADVYSCPGYEGRGGWSWYTGSAAWLYVAAVRFVLGMVKRGNTLTFEPHNTWDAYDIRYRYGNAVYNIHVMHSDENSICVDGEYVPHVTLADDASVHTVIVKVQASSVAN